MRRVRSVAARMLWSITLGCLALLLVLLSTTWMGSSSQLPASIADRLDRYLTKSMADWQIPGLAVAIVRDQQIFYAKSFSRTANSISTDTPFVIGSISKAFTATALMQLVDRGLVDLSAPVQQYLPWFRVASPTVSAQITIRHLLHHTSGFSLRSDMSFIDSRSAQDSLRTYIARFAQLHLPTPVGQKFNYSNANYTILGMVIESVSGMPYAQYIQSHLFQPLGMTNSFTHPQQVAQAQQRLAMGHRFWWHWPVATKADFDERNLPAGYLISTARDLAQFLILHLDGGQYKGQQIVSAAGMKQLHEPAVQSDFSQATYAMGWLNDNPDGIKIDYHGGELENFSSSLTLIPSHRWGIVVLTDIFPGIIGDPIRRLYRGINQILLGQAPSPLTIGQENRWLVYGLPVVLLGQVAVLVTALRCRGYQAMHWLLLRAGLQGSISFGITALLPLLVGVNWPLALIAQPDVALNLLACAAIAAVTSLAEIWRLCRRQK